MYAVLIAQAYYQQISIGDLTLYMGLCSAFANALSDFYVGIGSLQRASFQTDDFRTFMDFPADETGEFLDLAEFLHNGKQVVHSQEERDSVDTVSVESLHGIKLDFEFKNVSFSYPKSEEGERVLQNLSFKINKGETIGILGATGSGKSSLVNLISRFYDATEGEVFVDGVNVKDFDLNTLREEKVTMVLQRAELYSGTIKDNILWGKKDATNEEVEVASKIAQAHDFIQDFENGYDTIVAEKGASLSGGQKQRISIARALIRKPEILVFDDSTSALDLKTEANLYKALHEEMSDTTVVIIAQRVASVKNADKIIILNDGIIEAFGPHDELIKTSETYIDIYNSQLKRGDD